MFRTFLVGINVEKYGSRSAARTVQSSILTQAKLEIQASEKEVIKT